MKDNLEALCLIIKDSTYGQTDMIKRQAFQVYSFAGVSDEMRDTNDRYKEAQQLL